MKPHENSFSKNKSAVPAEISSLHSEEKLSIINHKNFLQETKTHILTKKSRKKNRKNDLVKNLLLWFQYKVPHKMDVGINPLCNFDIQKSGPRP